MKSEIFWFVRLGIEADLFTREEAWRFRRELGDEVELLDFAQAIIDGLVVTDVESVQKVAETALEKALHGLPPTNPFRPPETASPAAEATSPAPAALVAPLASASAPKTSPEPAKPNATLTVAAPGTDPAALDELRRMLMKAMDKEVNSKETNRPWRNNDGVLSFYQIGKSASDIHISAGAKPFIRRSRELIPISEKILSAEQSHRLNVALLNSAQRATFEEKRDFDYSFTLDGQIRFRINLMYHKVGVSGAYRTIPMRIPGLTELGLRNLSTIKKLLTYHNGLILVTGPSGSGKSTTLAAMVDELNSSRDDHIITVEDPIELIQQSQRCNVTQREVVGHTRSFQTALKAALREDPDVIVIGEMRDLETIELAVTASETGHLVIGTMHTSDASTTLNRLLDVFPYSQQAQIRASVAESLRGIVCERLLPGTDGGTVLACEILVSNIAVSNLIRDGKTQLLRNVIETGIKDGMCLMDTSVMELLKEKKITPEIARLNIVNRQLREKI